MPKNNDFAAQVLAENEQLKSRLEEAEATLDAIRSGQVDALVSDGEKGKQIFTLRSADYSYRKLVESMDQGALTLSPDGIILYCNKFFSNLVGKPLQRVIGSPVSAFIRSKDREQFLKWLNHKGREKQREFKLSAVDADDIAVQITARPLQLEANTVVISMIITDLTQTKRSQAISAAHRLAEQQLAHERAARQKDAELRAVTRQHSRLVALNKAKDEFMSLASHQLRTPATAVKQYVGMLLDGYAGKLPGNQRSLLKTAHESNERQLKIVDDLLKVARVDAGVVKLTKTKTDIARLLKKVMDEQRPHFRASEQKLLLDTDLTTAKVPVDVNLIRMALENVIDNAGKYSPQGQTVNVSLKQTKNWIIIRVKDKGVGISPKDQQKLFRKFSRIDNPLSVVVGGTGLGLYWTKKIVDLHGGTIVFKSELNKGSTFTIKIPSGG